MKRRRGKMKKLISGLIVLVMITAFMTGSVFAAAPGEPTESFDADTRASGITYGPWFGNGNESWSTDIKSLASATSRAINWRGNFRRFICNCDCLAGLLYIWHGLKGV